MHDSGPERALTTSSPKHQTSESKLFRWKLLRWMLQVLVGGIIFGSALGKSLDLPGFVEVLKTYQAFSPSVLWPLATIVTLGEFILGTWILSGYQLRTSALLGAVMNTGYAGWMTISLLRGLDLPNCGCFGVFFPQPLTWRSPIEDLVLVALCGLLVKLANTGSTAQQ